MSKITIDSDNFTEEQFNNIQDLIKKYNDENSDPFLVAAKAYAKTKTQDVGLVPLVEDAFVNGAIWHKDLLSKEDYTKIIYVLASAFSNPEYDEDARKSAIQFVFKLCKIFEVDPRDFVS